MRKLAGKDARYLIASNLLTFSVYPISSEASELFEARLVKLA
jgi:hypothetical protein